MVDYWICSEQKHEMGSKMRPRARRPRIHDLIWTDSAFIATFIDFQTLKPDIAKAMRWKEGGRRGSRAAAVSDRS